VHSHMEVAQAVQLGAADVGYSIRSAALAFGLAFIPLLEERFDVVVPDDYAADPRVARMFESLTSHALRRELSVLGYDASVSADRVLDVDLG